MAEIIAAQEKARPVVKAILRTCPDDVDDVLQEAAIRAFAKAKSFRGESAYKTWFVRIAINSAVMHLRKLSYGFRSGGESLDDVVLVQEQLAPEEAIDQMRRAAIVRAAIDKLTPCRRRAALRWLHGEATRDLAEKAARHHAKVQLREELRWLN